MRDNREPNYEESLKIYRQNEHPISSRLEKVPGLGSLVRNLHGAMVDMGLEHPVGIVRDED